MSWSDQTPEERARAARRRLGLAEPAEDATGGSSEPTPGETSQPTGEPTADAATGGSGVSEPTTQGEPTINQEGLSGLLAQPAEPTEPAAAEGGDDRAAIALPSEPAGDNVACARETRIEADNRWRREGRHEEVATFRDRAREEYHRQHPHCTKRQARNFSWEAAIDAFPPLPAEERPVNVGSPPPEAANGGSRSGIRGLGDLPSGWPELPANVALSIEVAWVQANRLLVVEEQSSGATVVHLERARTPAPSMSSLGWLETSIRSYAKFVDVAARASTQEQDEAGQVRRERMQIDEIRQLLAEMHEDTP